MTHYPQFFRKARYARQIWRSFGPGWIAYRIGYGVRMKMGVLRRQLPVSRWRDHALADLLINPQLAAPAAYLDYRRASAPAFFFSASDQTAYEPLFAAWDHTPRTPVGAATALAAGKLEYFEHTLLDIGFPPSWHTNPMTQVTVPPTRHWSEIGDFGYGDIKIIWEPSRFGFAFALVRAYWRTRDEQYAEMFWQAVEDWRRNNQPQQGPNWKCGQEISFRVMAWCFGLYGFLNAAATTAERVARLAQMIAVAGRRIETNLAYALSQRNNHGVSEGVGLWTIGLLFPELRYAEQWREQARRVLEQLARDLIAHDGAFSQHSMNYQRLMVHDYLWAMRLGELCGQPLSGALKERIHSAADLLYQLQDETTGELPCYGANDGALILPLSNCDYLDFRPVLQATAYYLRGQRRYESGPWDEDLLWLYGATALHAPVVDQKRSNLNASAGGYYTLRAPTGFAFVRCATYRDRPSQADMLHVDLWWQGQNVALDPGTYSYNAPPPWNNSLAETHFHNTVAIDGLNQMDRVGKFLWLPWLRSRARLPVTSSGGEIGYWQGEHNGYERLAAPVSHRRAVIRLGAEHWLVLDYLRSNQPHRYRLHWLLPDRPYQWDEAEGLLSLDYHPAQFHLRCGTAGEPGQYSLMRADPQSPRGWRSPYYNNRKPALSLALSVHSRNVLFWTLFGPESLDFQPKVKQWLIQSATWQATIHLAPDTQNIIVERIRLCGSLFDSLDIVA